MKVKQFYDKPLAHASYATLSNGKMAIIDPGRDPKPYYEFAKDQRAEIVAVFETHPHADFVSSHLEIHKTTGAIIFVSKLVGADYPHKGFDEGDELMIGDVRFKALNTPGHSPDSITIVCTDILEGNVVAFTGDTLFIGDVGRPDLRENAGNTKAKRESLAANMYNSIHEKLLKLPDSTMVYPAHGAGSLCGKNMSSETYSTMLEQRKTNWALQKMDESVFVQSLLEDQPFVPKYFGYNVELNKGGAADFSDSVEEVNRLHSWRDIPKGSVVVDVRDESDFKNGHLDGSINIMLTENGKFETWLGAILDPKEQFYLIAADEVQLRAAIERSAKIGYEKLLKGAVVSSEKMPAITKETNVNHFKKNLEGYTVVDVRNEPEVREGIFFKSAINIPLHELRERTDELPVDKPIMVHCAAGFRSAAGSSIIQGSIKDIKVFDLGEAIKDFEIISKQL